jgi:hypothetical protein
MAGKYEHSRLLLLGELLIARNFLSLKVTSGSSKVGQVSKEQRSYAGGQVPRYEPQGKTSWGHVCEHATR